MSSFWGGNGNGFSTTTLTSNKMRRQQSLVFRTIAGSLVAGACGYYGAHSRFLFFSNCVDAKDVWDPFKTEVFLFWSIDDIH